MAEIPDDELERLVAAARVVNERPARLDAFVESVVDDLIARKKPAIVDVEPKN